MRLTIFAYHCQTIAAHEAPAQFKLSPCEELTVDVRLERFPESNGRSVADQVYLDGTWCGNRCGGIESFSRIVAEHVGIEA